MISGASVICVDGKFDPLVMFLYQQLPIEGHVYTIRDVMPGKLLGSKPGEGYEVAVTLEEIHNPIHGDTGTERGFNAERFAPLEEAEAEAMQALELAVA